MSTHQGHNRENCDPDVCGLRPWPKDIYDCLNCGEADPQVRRRSVHTPERFSSLLAFVPFRRSNRYTQSIAEQKGPNMRYAMKVTIPTDEGEEEDFISADRYAFEEPCQARIDALHRRNFQFGFELVDLGDTQPRRTHTPPPIDTEHNVWIPSLADATNNLTDDDSHIHFLRYSISSHECQKLAADIIRKLQEIEQDGCYYGEARAEEVKIQRMFTELRAAFVRLEIDGNAASEMRHT